MPEPAHPARVVRVFVSSTFRDMHAEREELVKRVFPQLRRLCEERGVTWGEVDLRWGVPDEARAEGRVLPICLEEIQRCRPYFIALLGERYGWVPDEIPQELVARQPWLAAHRSRSVTELEILHGVLNNPEMASHAFFYFRDPAFADGLPAEGETTAERLRSLKARIRASGLPVREGYASPRALGALVYDDLRAAIDARFPAQSLDPLDREAADHEAFARSRARVYIGRQAYVDRLDAHVAGDGQPLVVLGEPGSGKSALLANWALGRLARAAQPPILMHFIGASAHSAYWGDMLRRLLGELHRRLEVQIAIPDAPQALPPVFANALHMAAAAGRLVIVVDALNQLEDRDGALDLVWLPPVVPSNIRLIVSTLPGRPLDALRSRGWPTLTVEPLDSRERAQLIEEYLAQYTKRLSEARVERLASAAQSSSPLYLRAVLEELRLFGVHERLDERIALYLSAANTRELYGRILERWEEDYDLDRPRLVRDALTAIWAARRGLSEAELRDLLGDAGQPLPRALWSPLSFAAEQSLVSRSGLVAFSHQFVREAVEDRYLASGTEQRDAHRRLADYFEPRELGPRALDELPWQLADSAEWDRLAARLGDRDFFNAAWIRDEYAVAACWTRLEGGSVWRMTDVYGPLLSAPETVEDKDYISRVAFLLDHSGLREAAYALVTHLVEHSRHTGSAAGLAAALPRLAYILWEWGRLTEAMALMKEQEQVCRQQGNLQGLWLSLGHQAVTLFNWGRLHEALALLQEQERICRETGADDGIRHAIHTQGAVLRALGRPLEAMPLLQEAERLCRQSGNQDGLARALSDHSIVLQDLGDLSGALALLMEEERLCRTVGLKDGLLRSLGNQGTILTKLGRLDEALALHKGVERLGRDLGSTVGIAQSLANQGAILGLLDRLDEAVALHQESERLFRELGDSDGTAAALTNQAQVLHTWGRLDEAMALYEQAVRLSREIGSPQRLSHVLSSYGSALSAAGRADEATTTLKEAERLSREIGDKDDLRAALGNQGLLLTQMGRPEEALTLHREEERLCRELGHTRGLAACLGSQAAALLALGRVEEALGVARETGNATLVADMTSMIERLRRPQEPYESRQGTSDPEAGEGGPSGPPSPVQ